MKKNPSWLDNRHRKRKKKARIYKLSKPVRGSGREVRVPVAEKATFGFLEFGIFQSLRRLRRDKAQTRRGRKNRDLRERKK